MKKTLVFAAIAVSALLVASCSSERTIIPRAVNTMNLASLKELNLSKGDYTIFNTITAEAQITYIEKSAKHKIIKAENDEFVLQYIKSKKNGWDCRYNGIMKFGFFGSDYEGQPASYEQPEIICRRLAIYRAINRANELGGDALVEPTISTNVEQVGKSVVFKSTVTAKVLRLNSKK